MNTLVVSLTTVTARRAVENQDREPLGMQSILTCAMD